MGMFEMRGTRSGGGFGHQSKSSSEESKALESEGATGHVEDYFDANKSPFQNMNEDNSLGDNSFLVSGFVNKKKQKPIFQDDDDLEGFPKSNESGVLGSNFRVSNQYFKN